MRRAVRQIAVLAGLLLALCIVCRLAVSGRYTLYFPLYGENRTELKAEEVRLIQDRPDVLHTGRLAPGFRIRGPRRNRLPAGGGSEGKHPRRHPAQRRPAENGF